MKNFGQMAVVMLKFKHPKTFFSIRLKLIFFAAVRPTLYVIRSVFLQHKLITFFIFA